MDRRSEQYRGPCPEQFVRGKLVVDPQPRARGVFLLYPPGMRSTTLCDKYRVYFN